MKTLSNFEQIAKKNKSRNRLKMILISSFVSIIAVLAVLKVMTEITGQNGRQVSQHYLLMSEIAYPNISYNNWTFDATSSLTGQFEADRFKNIDGIIVPYEKLTSSYSLTSRNFEDKSIWLTSSDQKKSAYTHGNLYKSPLFYNINHDYSKEGQYQISQDIDLLPQMTDQAVEVAVTFDKPYTIKEIAELVPDNLMINWYWIGSSSNYDTAELTADAQLGLAAYNGTEPSQSDLETFKKNLNEALSKGYLDQTYNTDGNVSLDLADDAKSYLENSSSQEKMTFSGLILTGRAENFKSLQNASWIFGSNIGQSVIIQPYHTLSK